MNHISWVQIKNSKRLFDCNNETDVEAYKSFLKTNSWGKNACPFVLEFPYLTVPDMIKDKMIHHLLKVKKHDIRQAA